MRSEGSLRRAAFALLLLLAGCAPPSPPGPDAAALAALPWDSVIARARGTEVVWRKWRGDPSVNAFVDGWVASRIEEEFGIRLRAIEGQGAELVNQLRVERDAGAAGGADLLWINGETFHQLRALALLQGPWAHRIPAAAAVDSASPIVMRDFEQDPGGWESPWGRVQFALIHDTIRTPVPPRTVEELGAWIRQNPGRFTHDQGFTGVTFLKGVMYALAGGHEPFAGGFSEERWSGGRERLLPWMREHAPSFWRGGETFPAGVAELHRLFANREVDFSMSNNENEVVTKIRQGILPPSSRAFLLDEGTIANAHYVGIPFNARNPAGAMVVADFLLGPEAQLRKLDPAVWGDGTVLDPERLPGPWPDRFREMERDPAALPRGELDRRARPEVDPEYHLRVQELWRTEIRNPR